jgi:hypothetical protein
MLLKFLIGSKVKQEHFSLQSGNAATEGGSVLLRISVPAVQRLTLQFTTP